SGQRIAGLGEVVGLLGGSLSDVQVHRDSQAQARTMRLDTYDADAGGSRLERHEQQPGRLGVTAPSLNAAGIASTVRDSTHVPWSSRWETPGQFFVLAPHLVDQLWPGRGIVLPVGATGRARVVEYVSADHDGRPSDRSEVDRIAGRASTAPAPPGPSSITIA